MVILSYSVMVTSDLVLQVSEEASLLLSLDSSFINNPFFIFEELTVLNQLFVDIGLTVSSTVGSTMYSSGSMYSNTCSEASVTMSLSDSGSVA